MRARLLTGAMALAVGLAGCGSAPVPRDRAVSGTTGPAAATAVSTSPPAVSTSPPAAPTPLPALSDGTGLPSDGLVASSAAPLPGAGPDGSARFSVVSGGHDRPYLLAPARRVAAGRSPALLVVLPAANTTLRKEYDQYGLDAFRDHGLSVLVAGTYAASWNAGRCCARAQREGIDDVAAVTAMRADAVQRSGADPERTAVVGHSVGALMAWRLACTPGGGVTSVVAVSGTLVTDCPALLAAPAVLALNGGADTTVPLRGSPAAVPLLGIAPPAVVSSYATLVRAAGCPAPRSAGATTQAGPCRGGRSVRLTVVPGRGHPWADLDATRRAAAFFAATVEGVR